MLSISDIDAHRRQHPDDQRLHVVLTGQIIYRENRQLTLKDDSGYLTLPRISTDTTPVQAGDEVRLLVCIKRRLPPSASAYTYIARLEVLRHGEPPPIPAVTHEDIAAGRYNSRPVTLEGLVAAAIPDDVDARWRVLALEGDGRQTLVMLLAPEMKPAELDALVGARVSVTGFCFARHSSTRFIPHPHLQVSRTSLKILVPPPADPFDAKPLRPVDAHSGTDDRQTLHQRATGTVLATWDGDALLLRTDENMRIEARLKSNAVLPPVGARVTVAGQLQQDTFFSTLYHADIRREPSGPVAQETIVAHSTRDILQDTHGMNGFKAELHGQLVEIHGTVYDIQRGGYAHDRLDVLADGEHIPVAFGPGITPPEPGSRVRITGICRFLTEAGQNPIGLTRIRGFMVIPRSAADLVVTATPPWWTTGRLLAVIGSLLGLLAAILAWNAALRRLAERRGRQLFDEQVAHISSDLRVDERSRLAIELHDSISQNLTAASFQIDTAGRLLERNGAASRRQLAIAAKTISSCREELRNCIWDLRSQTLEDADMDSAIRKTLEQHLGDARLSVRFAVPREILSDNTAHALLSILRELTTNAVRHGHATAVKIAGAIEGGRLLFSVSDNGCGFDSAHCPGIAEGHFGLQGIRERIRPLHGDMTVESSPDKGTRIAISIRIPDIKQEEACEAD